MSTKRVLFLSSLIGAILFAQDASATPLWMLPDSTYAEEEGNWQGSRYHREDGFFMRLDFTVYNTMLLKKPKEKALVDSLTSDEGLGFDGDYIYAYQIFNNPDPSKTKSIEYFGLLDSSGNPINGAHVFDISSFSDLEYTSIWFGEGVEPTESIKNPLSWTFGPSAELWDSSGEYIDNGVHSWFLVFSSDTPPNPGSYEVRSPADVPVVPEPSMLTLFSIGGAMLLRRGKNNFGRTDN